MNSMTPTTLRIRDGISDRNPVTGQSIGRAGDGRRNTPHPFVALLVGDRVVRPPGQGTVREERVQSVRREFGQERLAGGRVVLVLDGPGVGRGVVDVLPCGLVQCDPLTVAFDDESGLFAGGLGQQVDVRLGDVVDPFLRPGRGAESEQPQTESVPAVLADEEVVRRERAEIVVHGTLGEVERVGEFHDTDGCSGFGHRRGRRVLVSPGV